jgi:outer membrane autotransporter protein
LITPFLLNGELAHASLVDNGDIVNITRSTGTDSYTVQNGSTLNASNNAMTDFIIVQTNSVLNFNSSKASSTGLGDAVRIDGSTATIVGSTLSSAGATGLNVTHNSAATVGSNVTVTGSTITGVRAAGVNGLSRLTLNGTDLIGTGANGVGLAVFNGTAEVTGGRIVGGLNGVQVLYDPAVSAPSTLTLNGTHVTGETGSAIIVEDFGTGLANADITVGNGSTLTGANGTLLEVKSTANARFTADNSHLVGDVVVDAGATANVTLQNASTLTGRLENVTQLAVNSNAQWVMVGDGEVANLSIDGGSVRFGEQGDFYKLSVGNLSGNGTFVMEANFAQGRVDFLDVTGVASGSHQLAISSSGANPLADTSLHVVHIASGDAQFALQGAMVDLGTYAYDLLRRGNDWFLDASSQTISPGTSSVLALFNAAPTVWYGELSTLRSRMGEVRMDGANAGGWARAYGNKYNVSTSAGVGYQQTQQGFTLGADAPMPFGDGQWLVGVMAGYSRSDLDLKKGTSGTVDSYYAGAYTTWIDEPSGYYFDGVLKLNRFQNESRVSLSDGQRATGDYHNNGVGASLEFGRHIKLDDGYFIEPFTQLAGVVIQGKNYDLDNGMNAEGDSTRSLLGKLGSTVGRDFDLGEGRVIQPYIRAALVHEFAKSNEVKVNTNVFNNDLSGSRGELGAGVAMSVTDTWQVHADLDYSNGDKIEQPWGANVGVRYRW